MSKSLIALVFLWMAVLVSAVSVVISTQESRDLTAHLARLQSEENRLQIAWGQYLLEESALASYVRLEKFATEELGLLLPDSKLIVVVSQ